jgi:hypothetical protein
MSVSFNNSASDGDYKMRLKVSVAMDLTKEKKNEQVL